MADITMPQLGETVTEGTITRWAKQVGDRIEEDEVLFEVSTDKVDSEVPSPVSGFVSEIVVPEGETVDVGARLAVITDAPPSGGSDGGDSAPAEAPTPEAPPAPEAAPQGSRDDRAAAATEAQQAGATEKEATEAVTGQPADEPRPAAAREPAPTPAAAGGGNGGGKLLSPVVRRLISEHGLNVDDIPGTGSGGRITRSDVLAFIDKKAAAPAAAPAASPPTSAPPAPAAETGTPRPAPAPAPRVGDGDQVIAFSNIRRRTAEHMVRSLSTSAHTLVVIEVDYDNVDRVRNTQKAKFKAEEGVSLTYLPFIARAVVDAIRDFPHVNASVGDDELIVHNYVNLGFAVDLNFEGLIVPVVHDADEKRLRALAREVSDLANRARAKKLSADDISGGTFTITNAGGYGTLITGPIINQPQVAILSTDGVKPRPVAVPLPNGEYAIAVHPVGNLAISFDHRAYDGAYASAFLARVREILETRDWSQEL